MTDPGRQLYPFLYDEADRGGLAAARDAVRQSTLAKCEEIVTLRRALIDEYEGRLVAAAEDVAAAVERGGKLLAFGNGGSATDAQDVAADCLAPARDGWRPLPSISLDADVGIVTAVGNDVGFENVFVRQIVAYGAPADVALGFSTSGNSPNVLAGLRKAADLGMVTVAFAGDDGGMMAAADDLDHVFVVRTDHIPRIQEGHATLWHTLLDLTQAVLVLDARGAA